MHRKTDCTPKIIALIEKNVCQGLSNKDAAKLAGISDRSFYNWLERGRNELERVAGNSRAKIRKSEEPFVRFFRTIKKAVPKRKRLLIGRIQQAARGGEQIKETRRTFKKGVLVEEVTTEKTRAAEWQAAAWLLERLHPEEFGRRTRVDVHDWRKELKEIWDTGAITREDIVDELGPDIAQEFFESAGIAFAGVGPAEEEGETAGSNTADSMA